MIGAPIVWGFVAWVLELGPDFGSFTRWPLRAVAILLLFPILEEIVFRGLIQDYISLKLSTWDVYLGITWANWLTTLLFCLTHLVTRSFIVALLVIVPSLLLGALRDKGFSIKALAAIHIYWNAGTYVLLGHPGTG